MNLPNKITLIRILMVPLFMIVLLWNFPYHNLAAAVLFVLAAATDGVDGHIARSRNLVTDFGKFADPLADKLLVCTALICLVGMGRIPSYMVVIIIAREFIVMGLRQIAMTKGVVIAAEMTGKIKTVIQIIATVCAILFYAPPFAIAGFSLGYIAMGIATAFTIYSGVDYLWRNRTIIGNAK